MASVPFHYLDLRAFSYATEDDDRVEQALRTFLPEELEIERSNSSGHHGDPITVLTCRVERADGVRAVLDHVRSLESFQIVEEAITERVNENCAFFFRLDKQRAYDGEVTLGPGIQVRGKVEAYPAKRDRAIENLAEYFASW